MPTYTGYAVFKVSSINTTSNQITGALQYGTLNMANITAPVKVTFVKASDLKIQQNGATPTNEFEFTYRTKF